MGDFGANLTTSQDIENAIGLLDKRIMEMKVFFIYCITQTIVLSFCGFYF